VLTDPYDRKIFRETNIEPMMTAFDEVEEYERELGDRRREAPFDR
jgi:hypothetical protein